MAVVTIQEQSVPNDALYVTTNLHRGPVWYGDLIVADPGEMALIGAGNYGALYSGEFLYDRNGKVSGTVSSFEFLLGAGQGESGEFDGDTQFTISAINDPDGLSARWPMTSSCLARRHSMRMTASCWMATNCAMTPTAAASARRSRLQRFYMQRWCRSVSRNCPPAIS